VNCWTPIFDFNAYGETGRFPTGTLEQGSGAESFLAVSLAGFALRQYFKTFAIAAMPIERRPPE